jgi:hypothetical protein
MHTDCISSKTVVRSLPYNTRVEIGKHFAVRKNPKCSTSKNTAKMRVGHARLAQSDSEQETNRVAELSKGLTSTLALPSLVNA